MSSRTIHRHVTVLIQPLEDRRLMSITVGPIIEPAVALTPNAVGTTVVGYTPTQIKTAYGLNGTTFSSGKTTADGTGQTIAIIDAYNAPNIAADLATFSTKFGLATASLTVVSQTGSTTALPITNASWAQEISLDVEWTHAIAPGAKILLVEARSSSTTDLLSAVNYARSVTGVSAISMSWGSAEFSGETAYDGYFTTPTGHAGITFVASAGDSGSANGAEWPAAAAGVLSVGGTTLNATSGGAYTSETGWSSGGGGASKYEGVASFQTGAQSTGYRTTPDVSYDANPSTGMAVYDSLVSGGNSGWMEFGGTSAGAPQWAALIAIANQGRATLGYAPLDGASNTLPTLYSLYANAYAANFHDITSGSTSTSITATTGYDQVTGIGSPRAATLIASLVKSTLYTKLSQAKLATTTGGRVATAARHAIGTALASIAAPTNMDIAALAAPALFAAGGFDLAPIAQSPMSIIDDARALLPAPALSFATTIPTIATVGPSFAAAAVATVSGTVLTPTLSTADAAEAATDATSPLSTFALSLFAGLPHADTSYDTPTPSFAESLAESTRAARPLATAVAIGTAAGIWLATTAARERRRKTLPTAPFADREIWRTWFLTPETLNGD